MIPLLIPILVLIPYIVSYGLYKRGMKWYKIGIALSLLFWITTLLAVILDEKFNVEIEMAFLFYYVWMMWVYLGLIMVCIVFWLHAMIKGK